MCHTGRPQNGRFLGWGLYSPGRKLVIPLLHVPPPEALPDEDKCSSWLLDGSRWRYKQQSLSSSQAHCPKCQLPASGVSFSLCSESQHGTGGKASPCFRRTPGSMTVKALEMSPSANLPGPLCHLRGRVRHLCTWGASWPLKAEPLLPLDVSPSDTFIRLRRSVLFKE